MQIFKITQDGFKAIRKQVLIRTIPILLIAAAGGIAISVINSKNKASDVNVLPIMIPLITASLGFGLYRSINRQKNLFESYTLTITNNLITREKLNTPTVSIYFNEVKEIVKQKNGSFIIKGTEASDLIAIPAQIENYVQLETALQQIQPIIVKDNVSFIEKYQSLSGLLSIGLMLCVYTVNNKIIVALTGSALLATMIWSFIKIRISKNIDSKTKRSAWLVIVVIISVIGVMFFKLTGLLVVQKN